MLYTLIAALIAESVAFIFLLDRLNTSHSRQVSDLCQRLQAPETAVAQYVIGEGVPVAHLPFDDDGAWMDHVNTLTEHGYAIGTGDLG